MFARFKGFESPFVVESIGKWVVDAVDSWVSNKVYTKSASSRPRCLRYVRGVYEVRKLHTIVSLVHNGDAMLLSVRFGPFWVASCNRCDDNLWMRFGRDYQTLRPASIRHVIPGESDSKIQIPTCTHAMFAAPRIPNRRASSVLGAIGGKKVV